jgi:hypothetical protein
LLEERFAGDGGFLDGGFGGGEGFGGGWHWGVEG